MQLRFGIRLSLAASVGCFFLLLGCNRSTVVVPDHLSSTEESVVRAKVDTMESTSFILPEDDGGKLLAKLLPPNRPRHESLHQTTSFTRKSSAAFPIPTLPLPSSEAALPRLPERGRGNHTFPRLDLDEVSGALPEVPDPSAPTLPAGGKIRVSSHDVNELIPLPILATAVMERASLEDPTLEISTAAALAAPIPVRAAKAPFLKLTIPDPYDGRRNQLPSLAESHDFPLGTPARPPR